MGLLIKMSIFVGQNQIAKPVINQIKSSFKILKISALDIRLKKAAGKT